MMNFDGKAIVKNTTNRTYISCDGYSYVRDARSNHISDFCLLTGYGEAFVNPIRINNKNNVKPMVFHNRTGLTPHSVQLYKKEYNHVLLPSKTFFIVKEKKYCEIQDNIKYDLNPTYVSRLQPTNIKYNPKSVIVNDCSQKENSLAFNGTTVNVNSKLEVIIPEADYSNISIVVQKNSFIEIKVPDGVINIIDLPESLMYLSGYIKGTFVNSGEFNIRLKYYDGEQIINIMVPYYQRLL